MSGTISSFRLPAAFAVAVLAVPLFAQTTYPIEGYISGIHPPMGFEVGGRRFDVTADTSFGLMGSNATSNASPLRETLRVGVYVEVAGRDPGLTMPIKATTVLIRDDLDQKLSGIGVITRVVLAPAPTTALYEADGYLIRITPSTQLDYLGDLSSLAEVSANTWIHFSGKRGKDGILQATKAQFIPAKPTKFKAAKNIEIVTVKTRPAGTGDTMTSEATGTPATSDDGASLQQDEQVKIGLGRWQTLPADQPLQQRVHRIGMALVPSYQRAMADDNPSKIHFRFFAVDNNKWRGPICLLDGAVLIPTPVVERLKSDDQLAAVIADGVACSLQRQAARMVVAMRKELGVDIAVDVALAFVPGINFAVFSSGIAGKEEATMQEERLRIALALMQDAGYNPWQAPQAWRLLAPKKLPADLASLPYPDASCYQVGILNMQYKHDQAAP